MSEERVALYVRIPISEAERLDRVAFTRKTPKQDVVAKLIARHLDDADVLWEAPAPPPGAPRRVTVELPDDRLTIGHASAAAPPEVLTLAQAAELLQVEEPEVEALAEAGELPGRRIGDSWRFSRAALLAWLGAHGD
jgi:excisionase family DNA binding protein